MDNLFNPCISIEKFAAYLDGNLPEDEMTQISLQIENDVAMKSILDVSEQVDSLFEEYSSKGFHAPEDIANFDFELPNINTDFNPLNVSHADNIAMHDMSAFENPHILAEDNGEEYLNNSSGHDIENLDYSIDNSHDGFDDIDNTQVTFDE